MRFPEFEGEWEVKKLGEIGDVKMCRRIFNEETSPIGEIPFFKIGSFGKEADAFISKDLYLDYRKRFSFPKKGDVLISAAGTIGRTVVYNGEDAYFQDSNIVWIDNDNTIIDNNFLYYILQIVKYNTEGGTIQRLYNNVLKSTKFITPSISEQTKIASFLSLIDERIQTQNKIIKELNVLKSATAKKIFSQELRFKDDNGNYFSEWEEMKLKNIAIIQMGQSPDSFSYNFENIGIPLIQGNADILNRKSNPRQYTSKPTKFCDVDDLLLTVRAPVGYVAKSKHYACIGRGICSIKNNDKSILEFIYQFLLYFEDKWKSIEQGSTFTAVNGSDINSINILLPSIPEQTKIANFLSSIDSKIDIEKQLLQKLEEQKKYLLQQMFV